MNSHYVGPKPPLPVNKLGLSDIVNFAKKVLNLPFNYYK